MSICSCVSVIGLIILIPSDALELKTLLVVSSALTVNMVMVVLLLLLVLSLS